MEELQSWWEIPSIGQYVSLFRFDFKLPEMDLEELEEGLIADGTPEGSRFLENLIVCLVRGCYPRAGVNEQNWGFHLKRLLQKKWVKEEGRTNPLSEDKLFSQLTLREKVEILHSLCFYRLESGDVPELIKSMDPDSLRVQSLGCDDQGNVYWYFYGTRLYKEEPSEEKKKDWQDEWKRQKKQSFGRKKRRGRPRKCKSIKSDGESDESEECENNKGFMNVDEKSRWSIVCTTLEEWVEFTEKYKNSKSKCEISLFKLLSSNFLPHLNEMYEEKERRLKQKIMELVPRRISTRLETRKRTRAENKEPDYCESNGSVSDDYQSQSFQKERLSRDRAQRLEERNQRRISEQIQRNRRRGVRSESREELNESTESINMQESGLQEDEQRNLHSSVTSSSNSSDLRFKIHQALTEVKMCKDAWPFLYPVDDAYAPGYYEIIKDPIDLSTIENRLITGVYKSISQMDLDFRKMVSNCRLYNGEKSDFSTMALTLWKIFRKGVSTIVRPVTKNTATAEHATTDNSQNEESVLAPNDAAVNNQSEMLSSKSSEILPSKKRKRKRPTPGLKALNILAKASEFALKNVHREEVSSYSESSSDSSYKPSAFSDLHIVRIHSHASKSNSPAQEVNNSCHSSPTSTSQDITNHSHYATTQTQDDSYDSASENFNGNDSYSVGNYNSSNGLNTLSKDTINDSYSTSIDNTNAELDALETDDVNLPQNEQRQSPNSTNVLNNVDQISSMLDDCNGENMSNFISNFIKDNQSYNMTSQNISTSSNSLNELDNLSTSPKLIPTSKVVNSRISPPNQSQVSTTQSISPLLSGNMDLQSSLNNFQSEISTVDASVLGISTLNSLYQQGTNNSTVTSSSNQQFSSVRMPRQTIYSNCHMENSKKSATISSMVNSQGIQNSNLSSPSKKNQRYSPIYVSINNNQQKVVSIPSHYPQTSNVPSGNAKFSQEYSNQQATFTQVPSSQLGNITMQMPNQNYVIQNSSMANAPVVSAASIPLQMPTTTYTKLPQGQQNINLTDGFNSFVTNQLSPGQQITMPNGQIMIVTRGPQASTSLNLPATLNLMQTNASGASYQQPMYNSTVSKQVSPPIATQSNSSVIYQQPMYNNATSKQVSPPIDTQTSSSAIYQQPMYNNAVPKQVTPPIATQNNSSGVYQQPMYNNAASKKSTLPTFVQTNSPRVSYQQVLYNNAVSKQTNPPTLAVENQGNIPAQKQHVNKIFTSRPPKKRSPLQHAASMQLSTSSANSKGPPSNLNSKKIANNATVTYCQPMQVFQVSPSSQAKTSSVDQSPELVRSSVIMSSASQNNPNMYSPSIVYTNGESVNTSINEPTYVTSSGNVAFSTLGVPQQASTMQPITNYNTGNNRIVNAVPFIQKLVLQNGAKNFKTANIIKTKNGQQYILFSAVKDSVPAQIMPSNEPYSPIEQNFSNNANQSSAPEVMTTSPHFINLNNTLVQTVPVHGMPIKSSPMFSEVPANQLQHFLNIPQYIVATQSPTVIQQAPLYTQSVPTSNQTSMDSR